MIMLSEENPEMTRVRGRMICYTQLRVERVDRVDRVNRVNRVDEVYRVYRVHRAEVKAN